jgi:transcription initiation factor TFIID TATA-box-binding protein
MAKPAFRIENVDATVKLGVDIPLHRMIAGPRDTKCGPEHFEGVVCRPEGPNIPSLVFPDGKIVCTGAKSEKEARDAIAKVVEKLKGTGAMIPDKYDVTIENVTASLRLKGPLDLGSISGSAGGAEHRKEGLPCLTFSESGVSFLIFGSGKVMATGGRSLKEINASYGMLRARLKKSGVTL